MYYPCGNKYDCSSEYTSESDTSSYERDSCPKCRNKSPKRYRNNQCSCCDGKNKNDKTGVTNGKFGLAYIIETPMTKITKPTGWQIEFQDTPSRVVNNCQKMVKWVNCPPLGECNSAIPNFSEYPKNCGKLLSKPKQRKSKSPVYYCPRAEESLQFNKCYKNVKKYPEQECKCSCCKCHPQECLCIICEKCKVNTAHPVSPKVLYCENVTNKNKNKYHYEEIPRTSTYKDDSYYEHLNKKDHKHKTKCHDEELDQRICKNRHCCCSNPNDFKCKYCHKEMISDYNKHADPKLKQNFFQEKQKSNFKNCKPEDDLDYVPKKEKSTTEEPKNTQTDYQKCKTIIKVCDKEVETKKAGETQPVVHKTETNTIIAIDFAEKGTEVKSKNIGSLLFEQEIYSDTKPKHNFKMLVKGTTDDLDLDKKIQTADNNEKVNKRSNESVISQNKQKTNTEIIKRRSHESETFHNTANTDIVKKRSHESEKSQNLEQVVNSEKVVKRSNELVKSQNLEHKVAAEEALEDIFNEAVQHSENLSETVHTENVERTETHMKLDNQLPENPVESKENEKEVTHIEDQNRGTPTLTNFRNRPKSEIFTHDMTPMQKIKLALKIQKLAILESKRIHPVPTESDLILMLNPKIIESEKS